MTRNTATRLFTLAAGLALSPLASCSCGGPTLTCGSGTVAKGGACVPATPAVTCGAGTTQQGNACVADGGEGEGEGEGEGGLVCGAGTVQQGDECVVALNGDIGADAASDGLTLNFDAAPSPDGSVLFYVSQVADPATGDTSHSLFSVPADGSAAPTVLATGFAMPINIAVSLDGHHVFVADAGFQVAEDDAAEGTIFDVDTTQVDVKSELPSVYGYRVRGLDILDNAGTQIIVFTGTDPADGLRGVFVTDGGGTIDVVQKGAPFTDPSGVAAVSTTEMYVTDTSGADSGRGVLVKVTDAAATVFASELDLGYPAGVTTTLDGKLALVSGIDSANDNQSQVYVIDLATGAVSTTKTGLAGNDESGGLHRAAHTDTFAWADLTAGGQGTVFRITLK